MSTSAESAQQWLNEKQPGQEEVRAIIEKLEHRIAQHEGEEADIQGSVDALILLQDHLEQRDAPPPQSETPNANLDTSGLIPEADPIELEDSVKREAFEALKSKFKDL
ncbi:hypothetical protein [Saccharospirillum salsuginis]|uniref:Uncharacterized protein n=1 Tax=Saccharospirillum salsuginis TaxID=418750 RepID=A0A918K2S8_9GAMM|nr:hypothetical protein [Saccharospirillum salsuginis]GGX45269.1 hypothetical protein GCM10007392_10260 [Saccharospirillum salsuginis]